MSEHSRDVHPCTHCFPNRFRPGYVLLLGTSIQSREQSFVHPHGYHGAWAVTKSRAAALTQLIDVVTGFGLVCPFLDFAIRDALPVDRFLTHIIIVIRKWATGNSRAGRNNRDRSSELASGCGAYYGF